MKVCIATFHNGWDQHTIGGASSGPVYLRDQLKVYYPDIDIIALRDTKDVSPIADSIRYESDPSVLDNYDFVIFTGPGLTYEKYDDSTPDKYIDVLNHAKKFTFICNEENDRKLYPYYKNFLEHPNITFVTFNCPTMATRTFPDYVEAAGDWDYVSFCPELPSREIILERAESKKRKIMSTCRWTTSKRVYEYLSMSAEFVKNGIEVFAAGAHQSYWYNLEMAKIPTDYYTDLGFFEPSQIPELLKDVSFHWNFLFQLRSMGQKTHQPRLEIATMEAFREGCLPVICKEFTPEWVGEASAVRISKDNYTDLPEILGKMSTIERLARMNKLYDLIQENVIGHYKDYVDHIECCCRAPENLH